MLFAETCLFISVKLPYVYRSCYEQIICWCYCGS